MNACFVLSSEDVSHAGGPKTQREQNWQWQDRFLLVLSAAFFRALAASGRKHQDIHCHASVRNNRSATPRSGLFRRKKKDAASRLSL